MNEVNLSEDPAFGVSRLKEATSYTTVCLQDGVKLRVEETGNVVIPPQSIPEFVRELCGKYKDIPALVYETPGEGVDGWTTLTYGDYERKIEQAALALIHVGLEPHTSVGILSFNCPEWFFAELGAIRAGGVLAGIYPSNSAEAVFHVLETSDATVCVVDDSHQMSKVRAIKSRLPLLKSVIQLHGPYESFVGEEPGYYRWCDLEKLELEATLLSELEERERNVYANECAMLIFTSGTVGMPKGVMLSHDAVVYNTKAIALSFDDIELGKERLVTYLPLNHIAAQFFDIFLAMTYGGTVFFADRNALKGTIVKTFAKAQPTRMFGVPRIFEKFQERIQGAEATSKHCTRLLLRKSREAILDYHLSQIQGKPVPLYVTLKYWLATKVTRSVKQALGLGQCKTFLIGGAPVSDDLKHFYLSLDMPLTDLFGMSECGAVTLNLNKTNLSSVGQAIIGYELKIDKPDSNGCGEICIKGRSNFMGYLKEPEKTKDTLSQDGWVHSGDQGYLDEKKNLVISGRIKELIITAGGENIAPVHIEELIMRELPCVSNAILVGDHRKYLTVLLALKTESDAATGLPLDDLRPETIEWLESLGLEQKLLSQLLNIPADLQLSKDASTVQTTPDPKLKEAIEEGIKRANKHSISNAQKVQKFALLPHDFSIPTGELGPTLKVKRSVILAKYAGVIDRLYQ